MSKIALIYSYTESSWFSCVKIVANLVNSYEKAFGSNLLRFNYDEKADSLECEEIARKILIEKPEKIVFLDHQPHPLSLIREINHLDSKYSPEYIFHIYGDFTLFLPEWMKLDSMLSKKRIKFFCASDRQVKLVENFLEVKNKSVFKIPFPVDLSEFQITGSSKEIRKGLNLDEDSKLFLYTGRLSLQKNIIQLCEIFAEALASKKISSKSYLILAGEFESSGFAFGDIYHHTGEFYRIFDRAFQKIDKTIRKHIIFLNKVENKKLQKYYNECDYFVSLSTYHDEDYGMSVAEAGCCGMPLVLTDWAGFHSFLISEYCEKVSTSLTNKGPTFDRTEALEAISNISKHKKIDRELLAKKFQNYVSTESVTEELKRQFKEQSEIFNGFNSLMYQIGRNALFNRKIFFDDPQRWMNRFYYKVYDVYTK